MDLSKLIHGFLWKLLYGFVKIIHGFLWKLVQGFVKVDTWISLSYNMDVSKLIHGFVKIDTQICQNS